MFLDDSCYFNFQSMLPGFLCCSVGESPRPLARFKYSTESNWARVVLPAGFLIKKRIIGRNELKRHLDFLAKSSVIVLTFPFLPPTSRHCNDAHCIVICISLIEKNDEITRQVQVTSLPRTPKARSRQVGFRETHEFLILRLFINNNIRFCFYKQSPPSFSFSRADSCRFRGD